MSEPNEDEPEINPDIREQIIREGVQAEQLLALPAFDSTIKDLRQQLTDKFIVSGAGERNKREDAYWAIRALDSIVATLKVCIVRTQTLLDAEKEDEE